MQPNPPEIFVNSSIALRCEVSQSCTQSSGVGVLQTMPRYVSPNDVPSHHPLVMKNSSNGSSPASAHILVSRLDAST